MMQVAIINITNKCSLQCPGCFYYKFNKKENSHIPLNNYKKMIDRLYHNTTWDRIELSGGEPFLHPQLQALVEYTANKLIRPIVFTSGMIVSEEKLKKMKVYVDSFNVTIKYPVDMWDDSFKGSRGAHKNALKFLEICKKLRIKTRIHWVIDNYNYWYITQMYDIARMYNSELVVLRYIPFNKEVMKRYVSDYYWEDLCLWIKLNKLKNTRIGFISKHSDYNVCTAGITRLAISMDGSVTPCIYLNDKIANIFIDSWSELEEKLKDWRKRHLTKECIAKINLMEIVKA